MFPLLRGMHLSIGPKVCENVFIYYQMSFITDLCHEIGDHQVIEFSRDEVIQMMSCMTLGCFDGGMKQVNFLQWQSNYVNKDGGCNF